ncbi:hypothetical protein TrVFT333_000023 [Trichoderma virens FT-333]|nr:hypothetical protein TrVFT333_000023 [Trichoderma virens FT-333]
MDSLLQELNSNLRSVQGLLQGKLYDELQKRLHNHEEGVLPDKELGHLATESIDLLHSIEQMLEPGHLVLADHFLVDLRIADILLDQGPRTVEELASAGEAQADRLGQVMRVLSNNAIFTYNQCTATYENNHTATLLLHDHWTQWHNWVDLYGNQFYDMARGIPKSLQKGVARCPAQVNYDTDDGMFSYFLKQNWTAQLHRTLGGGATAQAPGILADYPWAEVADETIIDIGGGGAALIALLLRAHSTMRGGIFDLLHVIDHVTPFFHSPDGQFADLADRVPRENLIAGDFFKAIPPATVYTMKWTLHDWKEPEAVTILRLIRQSIIPGPKSRLVVLESLLANGRSARLSRFSQYDGFNNVYRVIFFTGI